METIKISEQEIVDAICLHAAHKREVSPHDVEVELMYDDDYGFSAEMYINDRKIVLITANMIEALRFWLDTEQGVDPFSAGLDLQLDDEEGIVAYAKVNR
ncbi:YxcD family protein [Priestia koreensis]|uniref:DUF2653 domain-containing protein n=1 Tax=Priestia koreensis TaxID=284581 RepID=A0A0M0KVE6_9BACI|nr:YxcD family protein [Priestia koreensis]KOO42791.1 hypothetical protein AMD01_16745 [Priestia koreensis]MCM3005458.1 YxcD family protein [Priestia koreensis]UNL86665.1 YxcD family protein [Priestia koreensis]